MAKINPTYENPIDNFIVFELCSPISEYLHNKNITPNIITTVGLFSSLTSAYFLYNYKIYLFMVFYSLAYFCDCLDGYMARKYNQETSFGDYYDHITDIIQMGIILFIIVTRYNFIENRIIFIITLILLLIFATTQGCQEILMGNNTSEILGVTKKMCPNRFKKKISLLKLFGSGTVIFYVMFLCYYLWLKHRKYGG